MTAQQRYENDNFMYLHTIFVYSRVCGVCGFMKCLWSCEWATLGGSAIIIAYARWRCEYGTGL